MLTRPGAATARVSSAQVGAFEDRPLDTPAGTIHLSLGRLPALSVVMALGLALVAMADSTSRLQLSIADPLFWVGITVLIATPVVRLLSPSTSRTERVGLLVVLAIGLYLVKVAYSPLAFVFPDELVHTYNVGKILQTGRLFNVNPVLPVTGLYPGIASVTAALASVTGWDAFHTGLVVSGATRVLLILAIFLIAERLSGSARVGGVAAALYTANPNYLFYSAEFGYEPLALALAVLVLWSIVARPNELPLRSRLGWTLAGALAALTVVVTHHITSYALVVTLWATVLVARFGRGSGRPSPVDLAVVTTAGVAVWLAFVASPTLLYLWSILGGALFGVIRLVTGQQAGRGLFSPGQAVGTPVTPIWQQALGFLSVLLVAVGLPFGLIEGWRRMRRNAVAVVLGLAGLAYFPVQTLRLTAASWETANRSSEFLFVGIGFLLAVALIGFSVRPPRRGMGPAIRVSAIAYVVLVCLGGVVASWRADVRLPRAYVTATHNGAFLEPQGVAVAQFTLLRLGPGNIIATDDSNALLLLAYGDQVPLSGPPNGIQSVFLSRTMDSTVDQILDAVHVRYLVVDRRLQSFDRTVGLFPAPAGPTQPGQLLDPAAYAKFDARPDVSRIADSGDIVVYDVHLLTDNGSPPSP